MMNNNGSNCGFAEEIVPFVYGEMSADDSARFRTHIAGCGSCSAELESFTVIRESIGVLKSDFDAMPTPLIAIPQRSVESTAATVGFFESLRLFLTRMPALASGALAVMLLGLGIMLYLGTRDRAVEVAGDNQNRSKAVPNPTAQPSPVNDPAPVKTTVPESTAKTDTVQPVKIADKKPAPTTKDGRRQSPAAPKQSKRDTTLIENSEEEDDTLRLADLFDEIGSER